MDGKLGHPNLALAEIAERQHGVVTTAQLRSAGISDDSMRARARRGGLHRVHRGVYAVGHAALSQEGRLLAAVLAVGGGPDNAPGMILDRWTAAVSHRSAAFHWGLTRRLDGPIDVIVRRAGGRAMRRGIRVHRSVSLVSADVTIHQAVPVTSPARTIVDLRLALAQRCPGALPAWELRKVIRQANVFGLPVDEETRAERTRSDLESDFLEICDRWRLLPPRVNAPIGPYLVDFLWPEQRLIVETDSYLYHRGKVAFQDDRGRDLDLRRRGFEVLHLSEKQVNEEPDLVAEVLAVALSEGVDEKPVK